MLDFQLGIVGAGIDETSGTDDVQYSPRHLHLKDGADSLNYEEVRARVTSVAALGELLEQEDDGSFFDWVPLATEIAQDATNVATLTNLAALFKNNRRSVRILTEVSVRLEEWETTQRHGTLARKL